MLSQSVQSPSILNTKMVETFSEYLGFMQIKIRRAIQKLQSRHCLVLTKSNNRGLCSRCSKLDLDGILSKHHNERLITNKLRRSTLEKDTVTSCVLCALLAAVNSWDPGSLY